MCLYVVVISIYIKHCLCQVFDFMGMLVFDPELVNEPCRKSLEKWNNCGGGVRGQAITYP